MAISRRLRYEILRRDGFACRYCHRTGVPLEVDHVIPDALGGTTVPENLVAACADCNAGKAATGPGDQVVEEVDARAVAWVAAMKRAAELQQARRHAREEFIVAFDRSWCQWTCADEPPLRPPSWRQTVGNWHDAGLDIEALAALIDDVMPRKIPNGRVWRYFCGAARNVFEQRVAIAQGLVGH